MSRKLRVYELARHYGVDSKQIMLLLKKMKVDEIKSHMSVVEDEHVDRVHAVFQQKREIARMNYARAHSLDPEQLKAVASLRPLPRPVPSEEPEPDPEAVKKKVVKKKKKVAAKNQVVVITKAGTQTKVARDAAAKREAEAKLRSDREETERREREKSDAEREARRSNRQGAIDRRSEQFFPGILPQIVIFSVLILVFILCTITFTLLGLTSDIGLLSALTFGIMMPTLMLTFFFDTAAVFEDRKVFESIQRSVLLVSNHMMEALGYFIVSALLCAGVIFGLMIVWEAILFDKLKPLMDFTDAQREAFTPDQLIAMIGQDGIWVTAIIIFIGVLILLPLLFSYKACFYKKIASHAVMIEQQTSGEYDSKGRWYKY